jgi:hypothetical protein
MIVDRRFKVRTASIIPDDIPEDNSDHHTRRRENFKSHNSLRVCENGRFIIPILCHIFYFI